MKVGIIGTGAIGLGSVALLLSFNHKPILWSPSGKGTHPFEKNKQLIALGKVEGTFNPSVVKSAKELVLSSDIIKFAVPAYAHKDVIDAIFPFIETRHVIAISSHASFSALYLSKKLAERKVSPLVIAWGTTILSGKKTGATSVNISTIREQVDIATLPQSRIDEGLEVCRDLFGDRFTERDGLLAIALSNLNPQNHLGIALCNLTRIEKGEVWDQALNITPSVGRLLEKLDRERLEIAVALDLKVRDIFEHFSLSFHVPLGSVYEMSKSMVENGHKGTGPTTLDTRYVLEDVPYGLVPTVWLGRLTGCSAKLHEAGIILFNALYKRDFFSENTLMPAMRFDSMSLKELKIISYNGA
jgi:opine dehydrogenase